MKQKDTKLGLIGLIAIVVGGIIGGGIFNIPKILGAEASLGAILIGWIISATGILGIALTFKTLNSTRADLSGGIFMYARAGFGHYAGFNIAWGYWLGAALGNIVFSIMLNDAFGLFFPALLKHSWPTLIFTSCFTWLFFLIVSFGIRIASIINTISTLIKFLSLFLIVILLFSFTDYDLLHWDFWGKANHLGAIPHQVNTTMLTTLFFFMGIEGAIVVGARARKASDVGKATVIGYVICLFLNVMVCVLSFGIYTQPEMAHLNDPALAQIMSKVAGDWARIFVNITVIIAVAGAWLVATIIAAELPAQAAKDNVLPRFFGHRNKKDSPIGALLITTILIQSFLFLVTQVHNVYVFFVDLSGIMILPTYILSAMFLVKASLKKKIFPDSPVARQFAIITGTGTSLYCFWVIYAGNIRFLLMSSIAYLIGILFYWLTDRQNTSRQTHLFTLNERYFIGLMVIAMVFSMLWEWGYFI